MDDINTAFVIGVLVGVFITAVVFDWLHRGDLEQQARTFEDHTGDALQLVDADPDAPIAFAVTTRGWEAGR